VRRCLSLVLLLTAVTACGTTTHASKTTTTATENGSVAYCRALQTPAEDYLKGIISQDKWHDVLYDIRNKNPHMSDDQRDSTDRALREAQLGSGFTSGLHELATGCDDLGIKVYYPD
jgi:hypothetical protein